MYETINEALKERFYNSPAVEAMIPQSELDVLENRKSSFAAAKELLSAYFREAREAKE